MGETRTPGRGADASAPRPIRALVVDDSVVVRRLLVRTLNDDPLIEVAGTAANGRIAIERARSLHPDVVTMDVEMPVMDGIEAVRALRAEGLRMPIIMFSTLTERGATATLDALAAGASDYVAKPTGTGSLEESLRRVSSQLLPRIHGLVRRRGPRQARPATRLAPPPAVAVPRLIVIGSSTGGPNALSTVVAALERPLPVPVLVVQHMPPVFTRQFAERLDGLGPARVVEAGAGEALRAGTIHIAPGGRHMAVVSRGGALEAGLSDDPPVNYVRPSVDVLFDSAVAAVGGAVLGVVLTGMGSDGLEGCRRIVKAGGSVLVQDEETSVVWGMPGAVARAGLARAVLPLGAVAAAVGRRASGAGE